MRILSLLPGATEVVCKLEATDQLVGRSHECDYPPEVQQLPACTEPKYEIEFSSADTDRRIKELIREGLSVYKVDADFIARLQPDLIITQDHCEACAVSYNEIEQAVKAHLDKKVQIVDFGPSNLSELYDKIQDIADAVNKSNNGRSLVKQMQNSFQELRTDTSRDNRPEVALLEWLDPLMSSGNWLPKLVEIGGGKPVLSNVGGHAGVIDMNALLEADPEIILLAPCGYSIEETRQHLEEVTNHPDWSQLQAVQNNQVYIVDANHYFNRPGPRLVNSAQIVAEILHLDQFSPSHLNSGWISMPDGRLCS